MIKLKKDFVFQDIRAINFINLTEKDKELVRKWRNHQNVRKWMFQDHLISRKEHLDFLESLKGININFWWLIYLKNDPIGVVYLLRCDFENKSAYLGIYSDPSKTGAGRVLMGCLIKIAFGIARLHALKLDVIENNIRATAFYKRTGFKKEGILKELVLRDGKWLNVITMSIINKS